MNADVVTTITYARLRVIETCAEQGKPVAPNALTLDAAAAMLATAGPPRREVSA
jgi:hypothetical protein